MALAFPHASAHATNSLDSATGTASLTVDMGKFPTQQARQLRWGCGGCCLILLIVFGVLSSTAANRKNATVDEPLHLVAGYLHRTARDFRIDPEQPALFGYWASLPLARRSLAPDFASPNWVRMTEDHNLHQWDFTTETLNRSSVSEDRFIQRSRLMFTLVGIALGAILIAFTWQAAGPVAAVLAAVFYCLDPNFLAHASVIKNDVPFAAMLLLCVHGAWRFGSRGGFGSLGVLCLACALAVNLKYSGLICGPILLILLVARAAIPEPWKVHRWTLQQFRQKLLAAALVCGAVAFCAYLAIWASYQWRFAPSDDPGFSLNMARVIQLIQHSKSLDEQSLPIVPSIAVWAERNQLLPQAWLFGFLYTYNTTLHAPAYLMGNYSQTGWWYYFPAAMLFKTPICSIAAAILAATTGGWFALRRKWTRGSLDANSLWLIVCIALPAVIYALSAITANINIGLRYILPLYPFIFVSVAIALAKLIQIHRKIGITIASVLLVGLSIETLWSYPDYLSFFNAPSRMVGELKLLGDSNLDWGQDLKTLARWQRDHSDRRLYLCYFGSIDPARYDVHAEYLPGGWPYAESSGAVRFGREPSYLAISATHLMGIHYPPESRDLYKALRDFRPAAVLGGSIYVYEMPLSAAAKRNDSSR